MIQQRLRSMQEELANGIERCMSRLTWIFGHKHGSPPEVARPAGHLRTLPVAVEGEGGMSYQRIWLVAGPIGQNGVAVCSWSTSIIHGFLDDRVRHGGLRHAPQAPRPLRRRRRRDRRRIHHRWQENRRARRKLRWAWHIHRWVRDKARRRRRRLAWYEANWARNVSWRAGLIFRWAWDIGGRARHSFWRIRHRPRWARHDLRCAWNVHRRVGGEDRRVGGFRWRWWGLNDRNGGWRRGRRRKWGVWRVNAEGRVVFRRGGWAHGIIIGWQRDRRPNVVEGIRGSIMSVQAFESLHLWVSLVLHCKGITEVRVLGLP